MEQLEKLVQNLLVLSPELHTPQQVVFAKRAFAREQKLSDMPTNVQILKSYKQLLGQEKIQKAARLEQLLKKRSIRSMSGIVPIQVLTKPFWCPGKCIFCPNDATMPKSYINTQPGAMRALLNNFDPYKQAYNRLLSLSLTGHATDKIEMIVLGGTRDVYPQSYKTSFIKGLYDACNHFEEFLAQIDIDFSNAKAPRYTLTDELNIQYPTTIEESLKLNETSAHRIIGLTIETRPEYVTDKNCQYRRELGVTRIEMGIQSLDDHVLDMNKRGHGTKEITAAMHRLRQYGFKISCHLMPGLYGSTVEKDLETFQIAYSHPSIKPDEIKFYPTAVIPNTELYDLRKEGTYHALDEKDLRYITKTVKQELIPPYSRIKRLARDFDTNEVVAGANTPNLRQLVVNQLEKEYASSEEKRLILSDRLWPDLQICKDTEQLFARLTQPLMPSSEESTTSNGWVRPRDARVETFAVGEVDRTSLRAYVCLCTRCREVRNRIVSQEGEREHDLFVVVRRYRSSNGEELFISYEDRLGYLAGFTRLLLPDEGTTIDWPGLGASTAMIRELHIYGEMQPLTPTLSQREREQHKGLGKKLMGLAEEITALRGYDRLSVISGIGVRGYYEKLGYELEGTYMVKCINA